jgi:hypothetical protein
MPLRKTVLLLLAALLCMSTLAQAAQQEDMQFVDANGATGFYVDVASIAFADDNVVDARFAVIKAAQNRRYVYAARFDRQQHTYQLFSSLVQQYDTKEVLESKELNGAPLRYGLASPMKEIVDYIFQFKASEAAQTGTN